MKVERLAIVMVVLLTTSTAGAATVAASTAEGGGAADAQSMVTLTVTVTDRFNEGIADAQLTATWDGGENTARTASNGKAFLDVPEGETIRIAVEHSAYTRNNPVVVEDASEQEISIRVARKASTTVTVVDDGTPVADAKVTLIKEGQSRSAANGRTDGDGAFDSGTIEQGTYRVVATKAGYYTNETTVGVTGDDQTTVEIDEGTVTVDVSVRDDHFDDPRPVQGASVDIEGPGGATYSFTTSGNGEGQIGLGVNARYTVTVTKDGYESVTRSVRVGEEEKSLSFTVNREDALNVSAVNKRVVVGEKVQLEVTDEYGDAVEGATVRVDGEAAGETNGQGVYRATIDSAGEHAITVEADGVTSDEITVEGVSSGGDGDDGTPTDDGGATDTPENPNQPPELPDFSQPTLAMQVGAAAAGVLLAFLLVRRLL